MRNHRRSHPSGRESLEPRPGPGPYSSLHAYAGALEGWRCLAQPAQPFRGDFNELPPVQPPATKSTPPVQWGQWFQVA